MKNWITDHQNFLFILLGALIIFLYFARLFFPEPALFSTPDFGLYDLWHQNIPLRYAYWQSLQKNQLPLWDQRIGNGFPIFAENQIGALNFQNLIFFKFLPFVTAFNLSYIFIFLTAFIGCFLLFNEFRINSFLSFTGALIFTFSGFFIVHIPHINLIHTASYFPILFYFLERETKYRRKKDFLFFVFFQTQCLLAGSPQFFFIINLFFFLYLFLMKKLKNLFLFLTTLLFALILCLPQIIPSIRFATNTERLENPNISGISVFPYNPKNILSFINPFIFGNPKEGTYKKFNQDWGLFWESTFYIGVITALIYLIAIFLKKNHKTKSVFLLGIIFFLLGLGKYTPLFLILQNPPFNLFRLPSRFIFIFMFSAVFLSISFLNKKNLKIKNSAVKYATCIVFFLITMFELISQFYNYNLIIPSQIIFKKPKAVKFINQKKDMIFSYATYTTWNKIFIKQGWKDKSTEKLYIFLKNQLDSDLNLLWNVKNFNAYGWETFDNYKLIANLLNEILNKRFSDKTNRINLKKNDLEIFQKFGINTIISPIEIKGDKVKQISKLNFDKTSVYIVKLPFLTFKYKIPKYIKFENSISVEPIKNSSTETAIIFQQKKEKTIKNNQKCDKIVIKEDNNVFHITAECKAKTFLLINTNYFEGNTFYVNNKKTTPYKVNLVQTGIWIEN